ncbi:unnamed protein product [Calicophoron daubneyi]|uniref:Transmembrane protein n=1 Tax=Calicophoron daubneyi TaxID=300641 RepID=A0AAV2T765_CALDB
MSSAIGARASQSFTTGGILLIFGAIFLTFGAVSWGLLDTSAFGFFKGTESSRTASKAVKVIGVTTTVTGTAMLMIGLSFCGMLPFTGGGINSRCYARESQTLQSLRSPSMTISYSSRGKEGGDHVPVDIAGDRPLDIRAPPGVPRCDSTDTVNKDPKQGSLGQPVPQLQSLSRDTSEKPSGVLRLLVEWNKGMNNDVVFSNLAPTTQTQTDHSVGTQLMGGAGGGDSAISDTDTSSDIENHSELVRDPAPPISTTLDYFRCDPPYASAVDASPTPDVRAL